MGDTNPRIEEQLDALAELCSEALKGDNTGLSKRIDALMKALLSSGLTIAAVPPNSSTTQQNSLSRSLNTQ